jgi:FAD/FMN-containing dehydrogenase
MIRGHLYVPTHMVALIHVYRRNYIALSATPMARVPADATAFAHRDAPVMLLIITPYADPATEPEHVDWTLALHGALAANDAGVYSNFLESEGDARVRAAYPNGTYERLAEIKRRYDPSNLFRLNQNIRPSFATS